MASMVRLGRGTGRKKFNVCFSVIFAFFVFLSVTLLSGRVCPNGIAINGFDISK